MRNRWRPALAILLGSVVLLSGAGLFLAPISVRAMPAASSGTGPTSFAAEPVDAATTVAPVDGGGSVTVAPAYVPDVGTALLGPAPPASTLSVVVGLPSIDPSGLDAFVTAAEVPGTPAYRQFLAPTAADAEFGASPTAVRAAEEYFDGFGLTSVARSDGLLLYVSGPVRDFSPAFATAFDVYRSATGGDFVSHSTPATLPVALESTGVYGMGSATSIVPSVLPASAEEIGPASACAALAGGLSPCEIDAAYNLTNLVGSGENGSGTTIAVVDAYSSGEGQTQLAQDLASFSAESGVPVGTVQYLYPVPTTIDLNTSSANDDWSLEDALDLEWSRAAAPGATIDMTFSPNSGVGLYEAIDALVAADQVNVVSMSWGEPDVGVYNAWDSPCSVACNATSDGSYGILGPVLEFGTAEGISFFAASGDCGSADGTSGVATNFPASDPYVTGVGGTDLDVSASGDWLSEAAWTGNATGASPPGCLNQGGSGGGFSPLPRPWWQTGIADASGRRGVPDVALDANSSVAVVASGEAVGARGTSVGSPIWAGLAAIADQYAGGDLGPLNPSLYRILDSGEYASAFHAITEGENGAYSAASGWNPVTGIGTPIASVLVPDLVRSGGIAGGDLATFVYASPRIGPLAGNVTFSLSAAGGSGTYPVEGIYFGDGTSALLSGPTVHHGYASAGVYYVQSFVVDTTGNESVSPPVAVSVGVTPISVTLTVSDTAPATGADVTFSAAASGGVAPYTYQFFFGDGASSRFGTSDSLTYAYPLAGGFCAEVVANDSSGPTRGAASARVAVAVGGAATPSCGNAASPLTLTPTSPGLTLDAPADLLAPLFAVTGGSTGPDGVATTLVERSTDPYTEACGCLLFRSPGTYEVTAWANDTVNDAAEASTNVTVVAAMNATFVDAMNATFVATPLAGTVPLSVGFSASVTGGLDANASATVWTFGNGQEATGASVSTTYGTPGEYVAIGRISDAGGGNASEAFLVDAEPATGVAPAGATGSIVPAQDILSGTTVRFTASLAGTTSAAATPDPIYWNLGVGIGHTAWSGSGATIRETYYGPFPAAEAGALQGSVAVVDNGLQTIVSVPFDLPSFFAAPVGGSVPAANALTANATVSPPIGASPFAVTGHGYGTGPTNLSFAWQFGDGTGANGSTVTHTFVTANGPFPFTVVTGVTDAFGDSATFPNGVVVEPAFQVVGGPSTEAGTAPLRVTFDAQASGGSGPPYSFVWTFPNGTTEDEANTTVVFALAGSYGVVLDVQDSVGDNVSAHWTITVVPASGPASTLPSAAILFGAAGAGTVFAVAARLRGRPRPGTALPA